MIINHNILAMNTKKNVTRNDNNLSKCLEKLSSGLSINRAADDAAGLAISEKLKGQISGLSQATRNSQDGISLVQVADGAMDEISSLLNRMRDLSVQAANESYTDDDCFALQDEVDELLEEMDRISNTTEFNGIPLLNNTYNLSDEGDQIGLSKYVAYITNTSGVTDQYTYNGTNYASGIIDFSNINSAAKTSQLINQGFQYTCCTCNKVYSIKFVDQEPDTSRLNATNPVMEVNIKGLTSGTQVINKILETAYGQPSYSYTPGDTLPSTATSFVKHYSKLASNNGKLYIYDDRPSNSSLTWPKGDQGKFELGVYNEVIPDSDERAILTLQVGANEKQTMDLELPNVTLNKLGLKTPIVSVMFSEAASTLIKRVDQAGQHLSGERGRMGAYQNRLEHTLSNLTNTHENLQAAESRIRDTDFAEEIMEQMKLSALQQAAELILAQANQLPNSITELLS